MEDKTTEKVKLPALSHVGIVVKDIDKAIEFYSSTLGTGPWHVVELDYPELILRGQKSSYKAKIAIADLGTVELELIQPISGRSVYSEFLDEGKEGLHHLGFIVTKEEKELIITKLTEEGVGVIQDSESKAHRGGSFAYLDTDKMGGAMLEIIHRPTA